MSHRIEFFFDLVSPYSYLASEKIEELAQRNNRELIWKPFLLGGLFKALDAPPAPGFSPSHEAWPWRRTAPRPRVASLRGAIPLALCSGLDERN